MATTNAMALCDLMMTSGCATVKDGQPPIFSKTNRTRGLYGLFARLDLDESLVRPSLANL